MDERITGSVLVTGAGGGIGREVVRALLHESSVGVIAVARDAGQRLKDVAGGFAHRLSCVDADLIAPDAIEAIASAVGNQRLVGLVHAAAELGKTTFGAYDMASIRQLFEVNVTVPLLLSQRLVDRLCGDPPGHIVCIGSMGGFQDSVKFPGLAAYSSSKAALACLAQCMAIELEGRGIRSNCVALGSVDTAMLREAFPGYTASVTPAAMGRYIAEFTLRGHNLFNGKVLPVSLGTP